MNLSGFAGLALLAAVFVGPIAVGIKPHPRMYILVILYIPAILPCFLIAVGLHLITQGWRSFLRAVAALRILVVAVDSRKLRHGDAAVLRSFALCLYIAGILGTAIAFVLLVTVNDLREVVGGPGVCLLAFLYAFVFAEGIVRPCAHRIEFLLESDAHDGG